MQRKEPRYENGITYWECPKCKKWLPEDAYYRDKSRNNNLTALCRVCHQEVYLKTRNPENARRINREYARRARQTNPDKFRIREKLASRERVRGEKMRAREILNYAVLSGKIIKPTNCSWCGRVRKVTGHHDDFLKPLQVRWLCYECHGNQTVKDNGNG